MTTSSGSRIGHYEILEPLGSGGMGEVYRARDTRLGRDVAIKVLPAELATDASRVKRFEKEARAASALNHPNIVTIHEIGSAGARAYISMERVEGKTLREVLLAGSLSPKRALAIAAQIADGLARAHEAGIVHRDLKPENLMVTKDGLVKILDFGLAKLTDAGSGGGDGPLLPTETGTAPGTVVGTVGYMSPEQAAGQPADFRSDQFSFGAILYEMAAGKRAFQGKTAVDTLGAILNGEPEPIARLKPLTPAPLRWIVERCLAKEPAHRYSSTDDLAREIATLREHLPEVSQSSGPGAAERPRRRAAVLGAIAAAALLGLVVGRILSKEPSSPASFQRITFRHGMLGSARFARDGETIVYSSVGDEGRTNVYLTRVGSAESRLLLPRAELYDVSSTDELAVMIPDGPEGMLSRMPLTGGATRAVVADIHWADASWDPEGRDIAVVRTVKGVSRLEYPIGRVLYESQDLISTPRFSPRGDKVAFYERGHDPSIAVLDLATRQKKALSSGWEWFRGGMPAWTPDGEQVWFTASKPGSGDAVWAARLSGKDRLVTRLPGILELFDISKKGRVLLGHHSLLSSLLFLSPGDDVPRNLSWLDESKAGDLTPDGTTLVISETREGGGPSGSVYLRKTDGSPAVRLGEGFGAALSPDGRFVIALTSPTAESGARMTLLPTGAGQSRILLDAGFARLRRAAWLPDGKSIAFSGNERGRPQRVYLLEVANGRVRALTTEGVGVGSFGDFVSPDGKRILAIDENGTLLWPVDGGSPARIRGLLADDRPVQIGADGESIYVLRGEKRPPEVWLVSLATGERRLWRVLLGAGFPLNSLFVTPDGRFCVYGSAPAVSTLYAVDGLR
jgi:serine/threonine protein kinase/dipeptidyl aminopeptidase/acylaminoacyl peptidase